MSFRTDPWAALIAAVVLGLAAVALASHQPVIAALEIIGGVAAILFLPDDRRPR